MKILPFSKKFFKNKIFIGFLAIFFAFVLASLRLPVSDLGLLILFGLHGMVPIGLAAVGEVLNERGGLFNIGLEGIMLISAFAAVFAAEGMESWIPGLLVGVATGTFISLIFSLIATYGRGNQLIAGLGINIFAGGFVAYYVWQIWQPGHHMLTSEYAIPDFVIFGEGISYFIPVTIIAGILIYLVLQETRFGLRIRAVGNNPFVADASAVDVYKYRIIACVIGGVLAGLAGTYMSLDWQTMITNDLIAGRGFIALSAVVFSGLNSLLALAGAGLFGFFQGMQRWLRTVPWAKPVMRHGGKYFFIMIPYILVLVTLTVFIGERRFPKSIGQPYQREK